MNHVNKKIKIYVVGSQTSYASWLNHDLVDNMEEADLVLFTGGADVDPGFYKEKVGKFTHSSMNRDLYEYGEAEKAIELKKPIWGTCRGIQLGCVVAGGVLIQHMNHPYQHSLRLYDGTDITVNSLHHQLQHPYGLHRLEYHIIGEARGLSNIYLNGEDDTRMVPTSRKGNYIGEAEIVYYKKINWLGAQHHPEMMPYNCQANHVLRAMIDLLMQDKLDIVLSLDIKVDRYVGKALVLTDEEEQMYEQLIEKRKKVELEVN